MVHIRLLIVICCFTACCVHGQLSISTFAQGEPEYLTINVGIENDLCRECPSWAVRSGFGYNNTDWGLLPLELLILQPVSTYELFMEIGVYGFYAFDMNRNHYEYGGGLKLGMRRQKPDGGFFYRFGMYYTAGKLISIETITKIRFRPHIGFGYSF